MGYSSETQELQIQGFDQALSIGDSVLDVLPVEAWILTLWGGLEVEILASTAQATKIQMASDMESAAGREPLFTIRGGRKI